MSFSIPTIDLAPFLADPASAAAAQVVADVRAACTTTGFFSLVGHGVPRALAEAVLRGSAQLFALPQAAKDALRPRPPLINRGYERIGAQALQGGVPDQKEGFFIGLHVPHDDARARRHPRLVGENVFPAALAEAALRAPAEAYYAAMLGLARTVLAVLARGLPYGDDVFDEFMAGDVLCNLRLLHYPPADDSSPSPSPEVIGAGAHTDFGAVTLLYQDGAGGLEVRDEATGGWVAVPPDADAFVVNIGDMLSLWTRGAYKSNVHRVVNRRGGPHRYSLPFFVDGNLDARLAPLDGRPGDAADAAVPVLTVEEHMLQRLGRTYADLPGPETDTSRDGSGSLQ